MVELVDSVFIPIVVATASGFGGSMLHELVKRKMDEKASRDFIVTRGWDVGEHHIIVRNMGQKTISECHVWCEDWPCKWRDVTSGPRSIPSGGAVTAILPKDLLEKTDSNPEIVIKSKGKAIVKRKLASIERAG